MVCDLAKICENTRLNWHQNILIQGENNPSTKIQLVLDYLKLRGGKRDFSYRSDMESHLSLQLIMPVNNEVPEQIFGGMDLQADKS